MMRRAWMTAGALLGWFALALQFYLTSKLALANGKNLADAVFIYLSYFTLLTNVLIAAQFSVPLWMPKTGLGRWFSRPAVQAGSALYIATVGVVYSLLLRHIWDPRGLEKLADTLLHDVIPLLYAGYWLLFAPKQGLRWADALKWLIYPLLYLAYSLARGAATGFYPYPFIDAGMLGYARALGNAGGLTLAFLIAGCLLVALGRILQRKQDVASK